MATGRRPGEPHPRGGAVGAAAVQARSHDRLGGGMGARGPVAELARKATCCLLEALAGCTDPVWLSANGRHGSGLAAIDRNVSDYDSHRKRPGQQCL